MSGSAIMEAPTVIKPQPGPQEMMMACNADIVFYGGAAFGGKSYASCLELARWIDIPGYAGVAFRRECPQITNPGGLWDTSMQIYPSLGGTPRESSLEWHWPNGAKIKFAHMQHEKNKFSWQGSAIPLIVFDELTHFTKGQFFYLMSRNRLDKALPILPYMRATMNPDPASWVREFIDWWIDDATGLAIPARSGVIRWFSRSGDSVEWGDSKQDLLDRGFDNPKSFTFISACITDNPIGMQNDPGYIGNLNAMPLVERERLKNGNWNVRDTSGMVFKARWFEVIEPHQVPTGGRIVRYWDRAATEVTPGANNPDWTVGTKMMEKNGIFYVLDVCRFRKTANGMYASMRECADNDGMEVEVWAEEDPGSSGKNEIVLLAQMFPDRAFYSNRVNTSKVARSKPMSAQAERGNIKIVRAPWNKPWLAELELFADWDQVDSPPSPLPKDDQVDSATGAYNMLAMSDRVGVA
jgi:predicted phage terminase large subunit-like protein